MHAGETTRNANPGVKTGFFSGFYLAMCSAVLTCSAGDFLHFDPMGYGFDPVLLAKGGVISSLQCPYPCFYEAGLLDYGIKSFPFK